MRGGSPTAGIRACGRARRPAASPDGGCRSRRSSTARPRRRACRGSQAVAVLNGPVEDVGDGFDPAMGMPRESGAVVLRVVVAEVVQQEEGIELVGVPEAERPAQLHARALDRGLRLNDRLDRPDGHGVSSSYAMVTRGGTT